MLKRYRYLLKINLKKIYYKKNLNYLPTGTVYEQRKVSDPYQDPEPDPVQIGANFRNRTQTQNIWIKQTVFNISYL